MSNDVLKIKDPNRGWRQWNIDELYTEDSGVEGRYVPNENDLVWSRDDGWFYVEEVDYTTGLSVLKPWKGLDETGGTQVERDVLLGSGPGRISESYRLYIDTSVTPHTMDFDRRMKVHGTRAQYVKVFRGSVIEQADVISRMYDQQGTLLGEEIPLELVATDTLENVAIKAPQSGCSAQELPDGETVIAVFYGGDGVPVSKSILIVENTSFIRQAHSATKYVTSIELDSPFLSDADDHVLECPINLPMEAVAARGIVRYSNGETKTMNIDGTKFRIFGLQKFISTIMGQKQPFTLVYYLSPGEVGYGSVSGNTMHLTESYMATTTKVDGAYSLKLFSYPSWVDEINGYRLTHHLYNLDRDVVYDVTQHVTLAANSRAFDPLAYGLSQDLTFSLDLSKVSSIFKNYRHLQTTRITLRRPGLDSVDTNWTVQFDRAKEPFGEGLKAEVEFVNSNLWRLKLDNGLGSVESWLREVYDKTYPLFDKTSEDKPPVPTHFKMIAGSHESEYPISMWDHEFTLSNILEAGENVYLQFFKRTSQTDLQLSTAALILRQTN